MAIGGESQEELTQFNLNLSESESVYKSICHQCPEDSNIRDRDKGRLIAVSIVCIIFVITEITAGILSNSIAIVSDAAHLLTDFGSFMVSLAAIWISSKPQSHKMNFGFHRAEVLGALISVLSLWLITGILVYMAVERIVYPNFKLNAILMIYASIFGIFANFVMCVVLVTSNNSKLNHRQGKESLIVKSAIIHVLGDLIQSIGVFVSCLIIYFKPELKILDPICTFIFSIIVLITTFKIMKDIIQVLMEGVPQHLDFSEVKSVLYSIPGVVKIHNMRLWSLTMDKVALSAHIVAHKNENHSSVLQRACSIIGEKLDIYEVTLQVEEVGMPADPCSTCT